MAPRRVVWWTLWLVACAGPPPRPPTAVIDATPAAVCVGDDYATPVRLSGRRSARALSLVPAPPEPGAAPLAYRWALEGAAHVITAGSLDAAELEVVVAGDRPLHATLTVTDEAGGRAVSTRSVGVTFPSSSCAAGCEEGTECVDGRCLPTGACEGDEGCPACHVCEAARCVPRVGAP